MKGVLADGKRERWKREGGERGIVRLRIWCLAYRCLYGAVS